MNNNDIFLNKSFDETFQHRERVEWVSDSDSDQQFSTTLLVYSTPGYHNSDIQYAGLDA